MGKETGQWSRDEGSEKLGNVDKTKFAIFETSFKIIINNLLSASHCSD